MKREYKYIYGPVSSWRLGHSLGIDPVSTKHKICSFDCIYCQAGRARPCLGERKIFIPVSKIIDELKSLPALKLDYITFSGAGEPTLAKNLGNIIKAIRKIRDERIAILTNSSLIYRKDVQKDLQLADLVAVKLDVSSQVLLKKINKPRPGVRFDKIIKGIKKFRSAYKGKLVLQIMFMARNKKYVKDIAAIAKSIHPDEIQLNTPLRPCGVKPLCRKDIDEIKKYFKYINTSSVYDASRKKTIAINREAVLRRRGSI